VDQAEGGTVDHKAWGVPTSATHRAHERVIDEFKRLQIFSFAEIYHSPNGTLLDKFLAVANKSAHRFIPSVFRNCYHYWLRSKIRRTFMESINKYKRNMKKFYKRQQKIRDCKDISLNSAEPFFPLK
jgi:hypothetical protein